MTWMRLGTRNYIVGTVALVSATTLVLVATVVELPGGVDWSNTFRPAAEKILALRNPYEISGLVCAPWALLPVLPVAILPERLGRAVFLLTSIVAFAFAAYRLGAKPATLAVFMVSPPVLHSLLNANIDWMPLLGFGLPPPVGLFFVVIKPQIGFGIGLFWLAEAYRNGGWRDAVKLALPVTLTLALSVLVLGPWPLRWTIRPAEWWNASLWPMSIPVGLALLVASVRKRKAEYAMAASPCLSPYVLLHGWSGALVSIVRHQGEMLAAVLGLWILVAIRALG